MKIARLKQFSFSEILQISKLYFGRKLVRSVPEELKSMHDCFGFFNTKGVKPQIDKDAIIFEYKINDTPLNFYLKTRSSDVQVFSQIIIDAEFKSVVDIITRYNIPCDTMLDAGANIGLTSMYFKAHFPKLNIIALEPSETNFKRLERNTKALDGVHLINKGIWSHSAYLAADTSFRDGQDWAFRLIETSEKEDATFEVVSLFDLIEEFKIEYIDVLKIDIEGGEATVFGVASNVDWLKKVRVIAIEIHNEFNCRDRIEKTLLKYGFFITYSGELTVGVNRNLLTKI